MPTIKHPIVGTVSYTVMKDGVSIRLQDGWESANIATVHIPQLKGVPTYNGNRFSGNVRFYKPAIPQLKAAFDEVGRAGLGDKILFWDGSFVPRLVRDGNSPSNHSFGTAFDINAAWNGFKKKPAAKGAKGDLHAVADIFKRHGFLWGGDWKNKPDGMHFEASKIVSSPAVEPPKPAIIIGTKKGDDIVYNRLKSADLVDGKFYADKEELLRVVFGEGRVPVVDYLEKIGLKEFAERGNHLGDQEEPRIYVFFD